MGSDYTAAKRHMLRTCIKLLNKEQLEAAVMEMATITGFIRAYLKKRIEHGQFDQDTKVIISELLALSGVLSGGVAKILLDLGGDYGAELIIDAYRDIHGNEWVEEQMQNLRAAAKAGLN